jgi:outer membrane lipoprotein-sorting protein
MSSNRLQRGLARVIVCTSLLSAATGALADAPPAKSAASTAPSAIELLKQSDRARGGLDQGISWSVKIETVEDGERQETAYLVKARGVDAHVETTSPARRKGEVMLFNDRTIWYFKPGLQSPVAISARQRLSGQAANGDIATTNYSRDYDPTVVGEEKVNGEDTYKLELKAKSKNVTYDKIHYWISKSRGLAVRADFLTLQGKVFKTAEFVYGNKLASSGKSYDFVSKMTIVDAAFKENVTTISYGSPKIEQVPASLFNINNVAR